MVWPAIIAGAAALGSAYYSSNKSEDASKYNTQAQINWNKQAMMNKHQWEVQDLRNAGLNPILSATNGSSAVPGISPQMPVIQQPNIDSAVNAYNASSQKDLRNQQIQQSEKQTKMLEEQLKKLKLDNERTRLELDKIRNNPTFLDTGGNVTNTPQMLWHMVKSAKDWFEGNVSSAKSMKGIPDDIQKAIIWSDRKNRARKYARYLFDKNLKAFSGNYRGWND